MDKATKESVYLRLPAWPCRAVPCRVLVSNFSIGTDTTIENVSHAGCPMLAAVDICYAD